MPNNKEKIVVVGLGETAHLAYEYFTFDSNYEICAFSANKEYIKENKFHNLPVVALEDLKTLYPPNEYKVFVAMASGKLNRDRTKIYNKVKELGYTCVNYISSKADVWRNVEIGENCFILSGCTLQPFSKIGNNVVLWYNTNIGHRSIVEDNCFIATADVAGCSVVGKNSFIGARSVIADYVKVAQDNFIAMGTMINKNTKPDSIYKGNPAHIMPISANEYLNYKE